MPSELEDVKEKKSRVIWEEKKTLSLKGNASLVGGKYKSIKVKKKVKSLCSLLLEYCSSFSNAISKRHAEFERHAEGTYTSDITSYLEGQAAKEFIAWLVNGRGRRE